MAITHVSFGAAAGLGLPIIGKLLGHMNASTTQRYAHLDNDPLRCASEHIGERLAVAMGDKFDEHRLSKIRMDKPSSQYRKKPRSFRHTFQRHILPDVCPHSMRYVHTHWWTGWRNSSPRRTPSLRHRPRCVGSAWLAQEAEVGQPMLIRKTLIFRYILTL